MRFRKNLDFRSLTKDGPTPAALKADFDAHTHTHMTGGDDIHFRFMAVLSVLFSLQSVYRILLPSKITRCAYQGDRKKQQKV